MINYNNSKIYAIKSFNTNKMYIGSTTKKYLSQRYHTHKNKYKEYLANRYNYVSSFEIIKLGDSYIELIEEYPCNSRKELNIKEGEHIKKNMGYVINQRLAGRTHKEYAEENKFIINLKRRHNCLLKKIDKIYNEYLKLFT